ncbi:MAG TPA: NAD(P)/FAD-dependent oxidoreductase [Rhizomicrobium sp.]|nr:NAD(P)/FAD-dependent oxidoreductase [Rhizomicrobium sp.]
MTQSRIDRRAVLGSGAALTLAPFAAAAKTAPRARPADFDVAIIGGGVAGCYTAWRLRQAAPGLRVGLFEMSNRIGGRLRSVSFPQAPNLFADVGGMRFLPVQKHVAGLVQQLNLPTRGFPVASPSNRIALRGKSYSYAEAGNGANLFGYNISPADQSPQSSLYVRAMSRIVPDFAAMTPDKWKAMRATFTYKGRLLKDWAAWTLLNDAFTAEERAFVQDTGGYDDFILYQSGLQEFDFNFLGDDESKPFLCIAGGYQRLPQALANEAQHLGVTVAMQSSLVGLHVPPKPGGLFGLVVSSGTDARQQALTAKHVVLALPRRAIERIADFPALKDPKVADLVGSVTAVAACKSLTLYERPWWKDAGVTSGRSVTDMPARQFYAIGSETERLPIEDAAGHGVLMAYADGPMVEYWRETVPAPRLEDAGFQMLAGDSQLAQEITREAALVYGVTPPVPLAACFQDWSADPYGGGWHFWAQGRDGFALADRVMQPIEGCPLFICGEAYTTNESGWVEGAVERAETMLQRHFGLKPPGWLA